MTKKEIFLVTGGCGFIGSHIVDKLIEEKKEVVVLDNLSTGTLKNLNHSATFYHGDASDKILVNQICQQHNCNISLLRVDLRNVLANPIHQVILLKMNIRRSSFLSQSVHQGIGSNTRFLQHRNLPQ